MWIGTVSWSLRSTSTTGREGEHHRNIVSQQQPIKTPTLHIPGLKQPIKAAQWTRVIFRTNSSRAMGVSTQESNQIPQWLQKRTWLVRRRLLSSRGRKKEGGGRGEGEAGGRRFSFSLSFLSGHLRLGHFVKLHVIVTKMLKALVFLPVSNGSR